MVICSMQTEFKYCCYNLSKDYHIPHKNFAWQIYEMVVPDHVSKFFYMVKNGKENIILNFFQENNEIIFVEMRQKF